MRGGAPEQQPDHVIVFDGICNLCGGLVRFVIRHDTRRVFRFVPVQTGTGRALLQRHGIDPDDVRTFLLIMGGTAYVKSDAVVRIARELGGVWRLAAAIRWMAPRRLRDRAYDFIAARRYRWFGKKDVCMTPGREIRDRFLD